MAVQAGAELPVAVALQSSSNGDGANVTGPVDIAVCQTAASCSHGFKLALNFASSPAAGDTFFFNVTCGDWLPYNTTSLVWGVDPTDGTNLPSVSSVTNGTTYTWNITVQDVSGNQATAAVNYAP